MPRLLAVCLAVRAVHAHALRTWSARRLPPAASRMLVGSAETPLSSSRPLCAPCEPAVSVRAPKGAGSHAVPSPEAQAGEGEGVLIGQLCARAHSTSAPRSFASSLPSAPFLVPSLPPSAPALGAQLGSPALASALLKRAQREAASSYAKLTDADFAFFRSILSENDVITDASALEQYNVDWMKKYEGKSKLALRPRTTQQVSQILKHCNERKLPVVPQGGNTGLVGGSVAVNDEVVLSLSGMDKILAFDEFSGTVTCQAGAVLQAVQEKAESFGYTFPLDLGAKGSCQIGGNVATNAGGLRFLRYGSLHGTVLGIEAVLADGTIIDNLNTLKKDNTGYDVKQLFIGSEGTLGVITGVAIALPKLPNSVQLAYLAVDSYAAVLDVFREAKGHLAEILSAVEFLDDQALDLTLTHLHGARNPLEGRAPFYMLIEVSGSNEEHDSAKLTGFLEHVMESGMVTDGTLAADSTQMAGVWRIREGISEALSKAGAVYKYDISLPLPQLYQLVEDMRARLADEQANVVAFGHIGDGNLHLNISTPAKSQQVFDKIEPWVFEWTREKRGSVSAEHGVGTMKPQYLHMSKSGETIALMKQLKAVMDPNGILNPYKVLPA